MQQPAHQVNQGGKWEKIWSNFENECFVQVLIHLYLQKKYNHVWVPISVICQTTENIVDDLSIVNTDKWSYYIQCKSSLSGQKDKVISQFYTQYQEWPCVDLILLTQDSRNALSQLLSHSQNSTLDNFHAYLNSSDATLYKQKAEFICILKNLYEYHQEELPPVFTNITRNSDFDQIIPNDSKLTSVYNLLKKIRILNKFDDSHIMNMIEEVTPFNKSWGIVLYNTIFTKALKDRNISTKVDYECIRIYIENCQIDFGMFVKTKTVFWSEWLSPELI